LLICKTELWRETTRVFFAPKIWNTECTRRQEKVKNKTFGIRSSETIVDHPRLSKSSVALYVCSIQETVVPGGGTTDARNHRNSETSAICKSSQVRPIAPSQRGGTIHRFPRVNEGNESGFWRKSEREGQALARFLIRSQVEKYKPWNHQQQP